MPFKANDPWVMGYHCYDPKKGHDKVYVLAIAHMGSFAVGSSVEDMYQVQGWYAARNRTGMMPMQNKGIFRSRLDAQVKFADLLLERRKKGYQAIDSVEYRCDVPAGYRVTMDQLLQRIDTTRIVGMQQQPPQHLVDAAVSQLTGQVVDKLIDGAMGRRQPESTAKATKTQASKAQRSIKV